MPERLVGGTLAARMADTPAAGNLHGKTGTLTTTSALAGYITSGNGERLVFDIVESGFIGAPPKEVEDAFAVALASPPPSTAGGGQSISSESGRSFGR